MDTRSPGAGLTVDQRDGIAVVTLDRPDKLNALTHALVDELRGTLERLDSQRDVRAVVLTGAGRSFCAGADLSGGPSDAEQVLREHYNPLVETMSGSRTPLIAAVNGIAAGAGVSLALACDFRVASSTAAFQLSFVRVSLVPDAGSTYLLPRIIGSARAAEMALLGRKVGAAEALDWGLVTRVSEPEALLDDAEDLALSLAALPESVGSIKQLLGASFDADLLTQIDREAALQGEAQRSPDYAEARAAFREKRAPVFGAVRA